MSSSGVNKIGPKGDPGGFVVSTILTGGTNLDDVVTPGLYLNPNANAAAGPPNASQTIGGHLEVLSAANWILQRYTVINESRDTFQRYRNSSLGWLPWYTLTSVRTDQTAGRAMYAWDELNNREQLTYGDTGVRNLEAEIINGWTAGGFKIRRLGYEVTLYCYNINPAAQTGISMWAIPLGFRPYAPVTTLSFPFTGGALYMTSLDVQPNTGASSATGAFQIAKYTTNDAWPTVLPGTASGSIPVT